MLSSRQLNKNIDSLVKAEDSLVRKMETSLTYYIHYANIPDSTWKKLPALNTKNASNRLIPDSALDIVSGRASSIASDLRNTVPFASTDIDARQKDIRYHKIEWHRKFSLSLACLVLFFIGAPLGSIIRKGGLGMPLVIAIIFFLIFHLLNMFGEKFVKESIVTPFTGMWLAIITLVPVGVFLTYKAMHDSQLFSKEYYFRIYKKIKPLFTIFNKSIRKT